MRRLAAARACVGAWPALSGRVRLSPLSSRRLYGIDRALREDVRRAGASLSCRRASPLHIGSSFRRTCVKCWGWQCSVISVNTPCVRLLDLVRCFLCAVA